MRCAPGEESLDEEARRLLWRCRRGMKELDVLLERYVWLRLADASSEERQVLTRLLDLPDPLLSDYLFGHAAAEDPHMARLVAAIQGGTPGHAGMGAGRADVGEYR
ncbi:MAG TPA: succinate dehydrogenase assembly factor 2 [Steroidobacteraceae bacterium]|nr:succinate dehydrogenase assembly factor 2 [Steroidobacteraceae bacterium]